MLATTTEDPLCGTAELFLAEGNTNSRQRTNALLAENHRGWNLLHMAAYHGLEVGPTIGMVDEACQAAAKVNLWYPKAQIKFTVESSSQKNQQSINKSQQSGLNP